MIFDEMFLIQKNSFARSYMFMYQVMPAVVNVMKETSTIVTLVKPQFECRRSQVRKALSYFPACVWQLLHRIGCDCLIIIVNVSK